MPKNKSINLLFKDTAPIDDSATHKKRRIKMTSGMETVKRRHMKTSTKHKKITALRDDPFRSAQLLAYQLNKTRRESAKTKPVHDQVKMVRQGRLRYLSYRDVFNPSFDHLH